MRNTLRDLLRISPLVLFLSLGTLPLFAEETEEAEEPAGKSYNIRLNPLPLLNSGTLLANFDIKIHKDWTLGPYASLISSGIVTTTITGFGLGVQGRWYKAGALTDTFFVAPQLGISSITYSVGGNSVTATLVALGTLAGYQWVWESGFSASLGLGLQYMLGNSNILVGGNLVTTSAVSALPELSIGYAF